ncbi:MAG: cysteine peptidase family C39 domain-containing protein, partial [Cystobacter sp.]
MGPHHERRRRWLVPEVVQTSAVDCGPAALKCLLEGFHRSVSYGRLRELCQTDVDGTSIDTLEEVALQFGLDAEQVLVPADPLWLSRDESLPAITITRQPDGATHFIVLWRRHAGLLQGMDPASGRVFLSPGRLPHQLYRHTTRVPALRWREWAASEGFLCPLEARLASLGAARTLRRAWLREGLDDTQWNTLAALDASARMVESLVLAGGPRRGRQAVRALEVFWRGAGDEASPIPEVFWSVHPAMDLEPTGPCSLLVTGAVWLR